MPSPTTARGGRGPPRCSWPWGRRSVGRRGARSGGPRLGARRSARTRSDATPSLAEGDTGFARLDAGRMCQLTGPDPLHSDEFVTLRPFSVDDVPAVTQACQDRGISRWTASKPWLYDEQHVRSWITMHERWWTTGRRGALAIASAASGELVRHTSLAEMDWDAGVGTAGYWVAAPARRRGVAAQAGVLLCKWSFSLLSLSQLVLHMMIGNVASSAIREEAGIPYPSRRLSP